MISSSGSQRRNREWLLSSILKFLRTFPDPVPPVDTASPKTGKMDVAETGSADASEVATQEPDRDVGLIPPGSNRKRMFARHFSRFGARRPSSARPGQDIAGLSQSLLATACCIRNCNSRQCFASLERSATVAYATIRNVGTILMADTGAVSI
jgi:hypothetical protein